MTHTTHSRTLSRFFPLTHTQAAAHAHAAAEDMKAKASVDKDDGGFAMDNIKLSIETVSRVSYLNESSLPTLHGDGESCLLFQRVVSVDTTFTYDSLTQVMSHM